MTNKSHNQRGSASTRRLQRGGFTLMETLVAVFLLSVAVAGPLTIAARSAQETALAKDRVAAFYLAQEGIEYVRFVRDTNKLKSNADWLAGLDGTSDGFSTVSGSCVSSDGSASCSVDALQDTITGCSGSCPALNYDSNNNFFTYSTGSGISPTIFTRAVSITTPVSGNSDEAAVTVTVTWCDQASVCAALPGGSRSVTVREDIYNWQ